MTTSRWLSGPTCYTCYKRKSQQKPENKEKAKKHREKPHIKAKIALYHKNDRNKEYKKQYFKTTEWKEYFKQYARDRYKSDLSYRLVRNLRSRLWDALKGRAKSGSAVADLGCSIEELRSHLESKWQPGMSWDNHSPNGWHIDHIIPLASFDLTDREQFLKACHYTNLQPLWAKDNIKKSDKLWL